MELNEFLLNTPKLNEIPKPGIKSHFKMAPKGREFNYEINNNLRFAATIMLIYPIRKILHFLNIFWQCAFFPMSTPCRHVATMLP